MMTFYAAAGGYKLLKEKEGKVPYIQRLGKLHPISVPEFCVWSSLLWQVMTYEELSRTYYEQMEKVGMKAPDLDGMLRMLLKRKLIFKGEGYTGLDALYSMMSDAFVIPMMESSWKKFSRALALALRGRIAAASVAEILKREEYTQDENRVITLVRQTPLSVPEVIQCFNRNITDVSTPQKIIDGIYPREDSCQAALTGEMYPTPNLSRVLEAVANLYLRRQVILEYV